MEHFVVIPDHEEAAAEAECLPWRPTHTLSHRSGRPWLLAHLHTSVLTHLEHRDRSVVLIGPGAPAVGPLRDILADCRTVADLDHIVAALPGLFHLVAGFGGEQRVQGTASGTRTVYRTSHRGGWWVSDRARPLARLTGASLDETALALRLLEPLPHPLSDRPLWPDVEPVAAGHWLHIDAHGRQRMVPWWNPPVPQTNLAAGADQVAKALDRSVKLQVNERPRVSSELSGGFDSTSLLFLAQALGPVLAITVQSSDPLDDDHHWAELAARHASRAEHRVVPADEVPLSYADLDQATEPLDEPSTAIVSRARVLAMTAVAREAGAQVHLTGHGGDHLFVGVPALWADRLRQQPFTAARHLITYRGMFRWPWRKTVRQALVPRSYARWLAADSTSGTSSDPQHPMLTWGLGATIPPLDDPERNRPDP